MKGKKDKETIFDELNYSPVGLKENYKTSINLEEPYNLLESNEEKVENIELLLEGCDGVNYREQVEDMIKNVSNKLRELYA